MGGALRPKGGATSMTEIINSYETVFILSTKLGEEGAAAVVEIRSYVFQDIWRNSEIY